LGTSFLYPDDFAGIRALYGAGAGSITLRGPVLPPGQPFFVSGSTLYVQGTPGNDTFTFTGGSAPAVHLNGTSYTGNLSKVRNISFNGGAGTDTAVVTGTGAAETFGLRPGHLLMTGPNWNVSAASCEKIAVTGGAGDQATLSDSPGNDSFVA